MRHFRLGFFHAATFLFLMFCSGVFAQKKNENLQDADDAYFANRYDEAAKLYKTGLLESPNHVESNFRCGLSLFKGGYKSQALPFFKKVYVLDKQHDKFLLKHLARAYQLNYQFDSAIAVLHEYETYLHKHEKNKQISEKELIDKRINECEVAKELMAKPKEVLVRNLGPKINSQYDDYSPAISANEKALMFTSRRDHVDGNSFSKKDYTFYEEVFVADWQDTAWSAARPLSDNVNGNKHDASVSLTPDGQRLIVYKSTPQSKGDLYYSSLAEDAWSEPIKFEGDINSMHFEPSATINSSENVLIFSSDRPGGFGGLDLYVSKMLPNGKWAKPENLGANINTKYDEDAPFLQTDEKTLHFSSNGHNSMGGYDIFTSTFNVQAGGWVKPENAGYPINTPEDDIYFSWNSNGSRAYFSSVREGGLGGQDIFMLEIPSLNPPMVIVKGVVSDRIDKNPLGSMMKVSVYTLDSNKVVGVYNTSHSTGNYIFALEHNQEYGMNVEADGYVVHSENIKVPKTFEMDEMVKHIELHPIEEGSKVVLNNVFFDYNKSNLKPESQTELNTVRDFLTKNPTLSIEIGGHTDSIGSYQYNLRLSESRALAVKNYLHEKGVEKERLSHKGYSFSKPVASNQTPEGRQANRRTEFIILETGKDAGVEAKK
jgi:outer membrane protein OmpA-like peptidoglycan-associated protein